MSAIERFIESLNPAKGVRVTITNRTATDFLVRYYAARTYEVSCRGETDPQPTIDLTVNKEKSYFHCVVHNDGQLIIASRQQRHMRGNPYLYIALEQPFGRPWHVTAVVYGSDMPNEAELRLAFALSADPRLMYTAT